MQTKKKKKVELGEWGLQIEIQTMTKESNCITNACHSFTEGGGGKGVILNNFGIEWRLLN